MPTLSSLIKGLQCPRCGHLNTYVIQTVEHTENVNGNTVTVAVNAGVCTNCGERLYDDTATQKIVAAVQALRSGQLGGLEQTGYAYQAL